MTNQIVNNRTVSSNLDTQRSDSTSCDHLNSSLFKTLPDSYNQQITGGYWANYSNQSHRSVETSSRRSNRMTVPTTSNAFASQNNPPAIAPATQIETMVHPISSELSHYTAANRLDDLLLI